MDLDRAVTIANGAGTTCGLLQTWSKAGSKHHSRIGKRCVHVRNGAAIVLRVFPWRVPRPSAYRILRTVYETVAGGHYKPTNDNLRLLLAVDLHVRRDQQAGRRSPA